MPLPILAVLQNGTIRYSIAHRVEAHAALILQSYRPGTDAIPMGGRYGRSAKAEWLATTVENDQER